MKRRHFTFLFALSTVLFGIGCGSSMGDSGNDIRYVAMGASDANGIGAEPLSNGYVYRIRDGLEEDGKSVGLINLGIPGAEIDIFKDVELPAATAADPDLITIFAGPNDIIRGRSVESFESTLQDLLSDLREKTNAIVVIATIPDLTLAPRFQDDPDPDVTADRIARYNAAIIRQAQAFRLSIADLRDEPVGSDVTSGDGFHPNNQGYLLIAQSFLAVILPQLPAPAPGRRENRSGAGLATTSPRRS